MKSLKCLILLVIMLLPFVSYADSVNNSNFAAGAVTVTGGTINGVVIGGTTPGNITGTNIVANTTMVLGTKSVITVDNISDTAYDATTWDNVTTIAPSKNAIRDKIETMGKYYGEMYAYNKTIPFNITVADTYHALALVTASDIVTGLVNGWTFNAGRIVDANITSEASGTGGKLRIVCSAAHGLTTGDLVVLGNMNNAAHNKPTRITTDATNPLTEFLCDDINYVAGAGASAGTVTMPAQLIAGTNSAGIYKVSLTLDGTAAQPNKVWKWELNTNIVANDNVVSERNSTNSLASITTTGLITVVAGDKVWVSGKNSTDTSDYTVKNFNLSLSRI